MTDPVEQEVLRRIESIVAPLRRQRDDAIRDKQVAERALAVAKWAVFGIAHSRASVSVSINACMDAATLSKAMPVFGENCAAELLHRAGLAFNGHAEMNRLIHHVYYMENHAGSRGVEFTPFKRAEGATSEYWNWPKETPHD